MRSNKQQRKGERETGNEQSISKSDSATTVGSQSTRRSTKSSRGSRHSSGCECQCRTTVSPTCANCSKVTSTPNSTATSSQMTFRNSFATADFQELPCNCRNKNMCPYRGKCHHSIVVYETTCLQMNKRYIGNTQ
jgi:hypothetical protein